MLVETVHSWSFTYDVAGIRDSKTVGSTTYQYVTQNGQVVRQSWGSHTLDIVYDNNNRPWAMFYDGTKYFYQLNLQGDVIGIIDTTGASVAKYAYDAWGRVCIVQVPWQPSIPSGTEGITMMRNWVCIISKAGIMILP